ncbi:MAG TPA: histidine kinase [Actinophytocola sp.]|nr:histidine kinase [Actinophytocola sp.]
MDLPADLPADDAACRWEQDLDQAGVEVAQVSAAVDVGIPAVALAMLGAAAVAAVFGQGWLGLAIIAVASLPWVRWLAVGDEGPTWTFGALSLTPLALLGFGHWFVPVLGPGGGVAYVLLALPVLLVIVLVTGFAPTVLAIGLAAGGYLAYGGPLLAAALTERVDEPVYALLTWHVAVALGVAAGYAARMSYLVNAKVSEAREARARQAVADERREVARDVHDVVAHTLAITMLHITAARMAVRRGSPAEAEEALAEAERHGRASLVDIRRIVRVLRADEQRAVDAPQPGLADVEALAESYRAAGLPVRLSLTVPDGLGTTAQLAVYRVLQEALTNAARHGSGPATVDLRVADGTLTLRVDNPVREAVVAGRGSGLAGMRERIGAAGGTIDAGVRDGTWVVRAVVPA